MGTRIHILIVDDEQRFLTTLAERLAIRDFDVVTATSGAEALERIQGMDLELALVDLKMPGMDGEELLGRLKNLCPLVEVVILTGHGSVDSEERCTAAGSYSYLHKPCETDALIAVLREAFEKRMMRRLNLEREALRPLIGAALGEMSFRAILRLKEIEEELLAKRAKLG